MMILFIKFKKRGGERKGERVEEEGELGFWGKKEGCVQSMIDIG